MENPSIFISLLAFIIVIGILVFVHEMGHYLVARYFNVKANVFAIGFGKEMAGWTDKRGTRWKLCALPLGGYVQFAGDMNPASQTDDSWKNIPSEESRHFFAAQKLYKRALIVFAGPAINFLFAIIILAGFAIVYGKADLPTNVVEVGENSPAAQFGIRKGDKITRLDGAGVDDFRALQRKVILLANQSAEITILRGGEEIVLSGVIGEDERVDRFGQKYKYGYLGVQGGEPVYREVSLLEAPIIGVQRTADTVVLIGTTLKQIILGIRSVKELGGPLKIAQYSGQQFTLGLDSFVAFMAALSINLGFINLLPIPMLDGGHLFLYAIEAVRRKPISLTVQKWAFQFGFAFFVLFMLVVTYNDLSSFGLY